MQQKDPLNVRHYGQVWTPKEVVYEMLSLRQNKGSILEPSCGNGAFLQHLKSAQGVELDPHLIKDPRVWKGDFFAYSLQNQFDTIIGNPPYVRYQDILPSTKKHLPMEWFDGRSNLYLFFIAKSMGHLREEGELIFITPRDFLKATSAKKLNYNLYTQGTITHYKELGDGSIFKGYAPNCAIWRWQKGLLSHRLSNGKAWFNHHQGQLWFSALKPSKCSVKDIFDVKVGAVSGADFIFANEKYGNVDMVFSQTAVTGKTRKMIYNKKERSLDPHKKTLMNRRIRAFNESNWWEWGRQHCDRPGPRIYVNCKTRNPKPFFTHPSRFYDGSLLALFPKDPLMDVLPVIEQLNQINWSELGFACGGRLIFNQHSLANAPLELSL